jgi:ribonuclease Z
MSRRSLPLGVLLLVSLHAAAETPREAPLRVTFLGTGGGPAVSADHAGPSALVEFNDEVLLIDAGRGAVQRLQLVQRSPGSVAQVFLTHLHSDHTVGLPELWLSGWWRGRKAPLEVLGPEGTRAMAANIQKAWDYDLSIRSRAPEDLPRKAADLVGTDIKPGIVYRGNGLTVTAITVDHGPVLCYGYRIDAGGHSIVFSGDDRASENLIEHSQNVDVLVHDMSGFTPEELADTGAGGQRRRAALLLLGTPEQAGTVFARSHCKLAVYTHYTHKSDQIARTRATYNGPLEAAEDLTQITIGAEIALKHLAPAATP